VEASPFIVVVIGKSPQVRYLDDAWCCLTYVAGDADVWSRFSSHVQETRQVLPPVWIQVSCA
jgi:hypothetical protein